MLYIGCHLSYSKGYEAMGRQALDIDANTFAFFTRNPRGGSAKTIDEADAAALRQILENNKFGKLLRIAKILSSKSFLYRKLCNFNGSYFCFRRFYRTCNRLAFQ